MGDLILWLYSVFGDYSTPLIIQFFSIIESLIISFIVFSRKTYRKNFKLTIPLTIIYIIAYIFLSALIRYAMAGTGAWLQIVTLFMSCIFVFLFEFLLIDTSLEGKLLDTISVLAIGTIGGRLYSLLLNAFGVDEKIGIFFIKDMPMGLEYLFYWLIHIAMYACFIPFFRKKRRPVSSKRMRLYAIILSAVMMLILELTITFARNYDGLSPLSYINKALCILLGFAILFIQRYFYYHNNKYEEQLVVNEMMKEEEAQFEDLRSSISVINAKLHDLKHQIEDFQDRITSEELEKFKAAAETYDSMFDTGNRVLDIILYEKKMICMDRSIAFSSLADGAVVAHMDNTSLYSLLSNAISNAIEASLKIKEEDRFIGVNIYQKLGIGYIEISNRFDGVINKDKNGRPITSKKDETTMHGLGYTSMTFIAQKYNGYIITSNTDSVYTLKIVLPLS
ncbi:MAG: GHKL domain-containing protein [Erysipelotrichaceae bacterium]|nr:GHKL domain-containing protein [Erysipelotrichaceae bacterium]